MQNILYTYGGEARVESHKIFPMVSSDVDAWLYTVTKDHMKKHHKEYFLAEIGPEAFKRNLTHRNAITTGWKRVG